MMHILFGDSVAGGLKFALKEMGTAEAGKVISFWNQLAVGPLQGYPEAEGLEARFLWLKNIRYDWYRDFQEYQQEVKKTIAQITEIPDVVPITIWAADNAHEQTGLRCVLHLLRGKSNAIKVIYTTKAYAEMFNRPDLQYTVLNTGEITPEKLRLIYEQNSEEVLSEGARKELAAEWQALGVSPATLRIWHNELLQGVPEDYYDRELIEAAQRLQIQLEQEGGDESAAFMKAARVIGDALGHSEQYVGDAFLEYRLRELIGKGIFAMTGDLQAMRYYSVKLLSPG